MRRLMLLRHAKSDWTASGRATTTGRSVARGREAAPKMGAYMARHALVPDLDRRLPGDARARNARSLLPAFNEAPKVHHEERIYESEARTRCSRSSRRRRRRCIACCWSATIPALAELASLLMASGDVEARQQLIEKFPTAALAVIDFAFDDWGKLHPKAGRLDRFVVPRTLDTETA